MTLRGMIRGGVVVLENGASLPEGTPVTVIPTLPAEPTSTTPSKQSVGERLAALGRWAESQPCDLPEDLAKNHDHYLHGLPKKP